VSEHGDDVAEGDAVGSRWPELLTALLFMAIAAVVMFDSRRVGAGWADDGPQSGYFPFYIGLAMFCAGAWTAVMQVRRWAQVEVFAERSQLRSVFTILWPMLVYVALIPWLGIYVASFLLIGFFMLRHGRHHVALTAAVAVAVPLIFFLVFERWFLVPLPKGPVEAMLGF
jgi:hypothetical protein